MISNRTFLQLLFISLLIIPVKTFAGNSFSKSKFHYITVSNGLPQNTIQCIEKDQYGFMWFGTDNGLCRFDGYDFDYYSASKNGNSLWDNRILDVINGAHNYLWIITPKGMQVFNTQKVSFEEIKNEELNSLFKKEIVKVINFNNDVWIATKHEGVYKIKESHEISKSTILSSCFKENRLPVINTMIVDHDNRLYLGTSKGLFVFNDKTNDFVSVSNNFPGWDALDIQTMFSRNNELWIGTLTGLYAYNLLTKSVKAYHHIPLNPGTILHSQVNSIASAPTGEILVGTLGGLSVYNSIEDNFSEVNLFPDSPHSDHDVFISAIYSDSLGNIWVGTEKTGLVHLYAYTKSFQSLPETDQFKLFNTSIINSIYSSEDELWVGTAGSGILNYNKQTGRVKHFKTKVNDPSSIESDFITSIVKDNQDNIWAGTWGLGLNKIVNKGRKVIKYHTFNGLPSEYVSCVYITKQGFNVIGTQGGLGVFDENKNTIIPLDITRGVDGIIWEVGCIKEDKKGYLWIGTTNGLFRFKTDLINPEREIKLTKYDVITYKQTNTKGSLPNDYITCLETDKDGNMWLGTYGNGIAKCIPIKDGEYTFQSYTEEDGLANNVVYKILADENNNLWISTENGLSNFIQKDSLFINQYSVDGLRNDQYYWSAGYKAEDGYLYFGGINGLNYFHPDSIQSYPYSSKPYITKLNVFNESVKPGEKRHGLVYINKSVLDADTVNISFKDNIFSLEFSALPYYLSNKLKYAYRLVGVDKDWVYVNADRRIASYTNLDGGDYLFQVKSTNLDGIWNDNITEVLIKIKPPFWKTNWFQIGSIFLIFILIYAYTRYRSFRISQQKKHLEELVKQRTQEINEKNIQLEQNSVTLKLNNEQLASRQKEIEEQKSTLEKQNKEIISQRDQLIALNKEVEGIHQMRMQFFTNISHEFRTPLTLIISPIEKILSKNYNFTKEGVISALSYVKRNAERLLLLTNEITTFRKYEAGKVKVMLTHGDVGDFIKDIAESFRQLAESKGIHLVSTVDYNLEESWFDKSKLENILFNLLSNALKYTHEGGTVSVNVTKIKGDHSKLLINIQDNGIGISKENQAKVFDRFFRDSSNQGNTSYGTGIGLSLTKQMVEVMNGTITLDSEVNKGTSFKVMLPVDKEDFTDFNVDEGEETNQINLKERIELLAEAELKSGQDEDSAVVEDKRKACVLIVEDNNDLRDFLNETLSDTYNVSTAMDGEQGYKMALEKEFDLIVSDIMMPKVDGLEMCKQLKNNLHTSHIPIILLTAKGQEEDFVQGLEYGADDYMAKPFNANILQAKITSLIENRKKLAKKYMQLDPEAEPVEISTSSLDDEFMDKLNQVVADNYTDPTFDIDAFSSQLFVSRSLLYKKLKALTNVSPNEYVNMYRLKKSIGLLKSKQYQVSEVAYMIGFNDPKYFSRVFKKFYNISPSSYLE